MYQVTNHLNIDFQGDLKKKIPQIRNKYCPWQPCMFFARSIFLWRTSSSHTLFHFVPNNKSFGPVVQMNFFFKASAVQNYMNELPILMGFFVGSRWNEKFLYRTSQTSFLQSWFSIDPVVPEQIIKMWNVYKKGRQLNQSDNNRSHDI